MPTPDEIHDFFEKQKIKILESVKEAYILACMEAVNFARTTDTYKDRTNNLRSSIGFVLYYNGEIVHEDFQITGKGTGAGGDVSFTTKAGKDVSFTAKNSGPDGQTGISAAKELANKVASRHPDGFVAVIVAGMHYALFVEAKGFDVLTGATLNLSENIRKHFDAIDKVHGTNFARI